MLPENEIHIWFVPIDNFSGEIDALSAFLSKEEIFRSDKFYSEIDRNKFIILRSALRKILGKYLDTDPRNIRFKNNAFGKPYLHPDSDVTSVNFNLSHSGNYGVFAFSNKIELGIDIEKTRIVSDMSAIAKRFFSATESEVILNLADELQTDSFFKCWTMKEAYVKACGKGFSIPLDKFSIDFLSPAPKLLNVDWDPGEISKWQIYSLNAPSGYMASLVALGGKHQIIIRKLEELSL